METALIFTVAVLVGLLLTGIIITESKRKDMVLTLAPIGIYHTKAGNVFDLREYFVDKNNNLYSANLDTWEINHRKNRDILKCSDKSFNQNGDLVNSLRDSRGYKATIARKNLNFQKLSFNNGVVSVIMEETTPRHFKVNRLFDHRSPEVKALIYSVESDLSVGSK